ncbi:peptidoglycan-associated lipoprotein [Rhodovulum iodosum]|uniref:Peptidoglycan-associated lipoprotein n=1 Tax=Rhodovulum iodosum TaxID=68291 RepID=A0ABV3XX56_9RHOB|nr:OmpA family protein [Rhodovulum robiginosum]RSK36764.1 OmpA family protein [Rhodovulum robiginosum]
MRGPLVLLSVSALVALGGCNPAAINAPAGSTLDSGDFGNATMNNTLVMNGERDAVISLSRRFAAEAPTTINFDFDSAVLDGTAQAALARQAEWIAQYPSVRFRVYGHTDKVGSNSYNKRLGLRRARAAVNYLVSRGISRSRLEAVVSYGETQPLIVTENRERRNRRTVTEVSGFLKRKPLVHDGKYMQRTYEEYVDSATELHAIVGDE